MSAVGAGGDALPPNENVGPLLLGVSGVLILFVCVSSALRLWVRGALRTLGLDDATMALVTVISIIRYGLQIVQVVSYGNGKHRPYVNEEDYRMNNQLGWWAQICLFSGICLLKVSIMLLIMRMKDSKKLKIVLYSAMAGLVITNFGVIVILLAECSPVRIYAIYFTIAYSILTDFLCSLLPLVVIWKVRIPLKTKIMACSLMSLGLVATGFGIARAASLGLVTTDLTYLPLLLPWSNHPHDSKYGDRNNYVRSSFSQSNPRSGHITDKLRSGAGESVIDRAATLIESRRKVSMSRSDGSELSSSLASARRRSFGSPRAVTKARARQVARDRCAIDYFGPAPVRFNKS
ncbi:unnamed protein product [Parascedosporium putredinis]|uniref:Rhodopsin domain-containing protein n=1 Tax=Parascedosporium putredinis TaxID=1442378 RepID=A0A9P1GXS9_9PEZI|nr:unnamed protein product [Parascedosporium putredinis]CAI7990098.1 unnamed protein product [Parascedosporium putredinis]